MPPNRKSNAEVIQAVRSSSFENIVLTVQPKFLPLTHVTSSEVSTSAASSSSNGVIYAKDHTQKESDSYWDWSPVKPATVVEEVVVDKQTILDEEIVEQEAIREFLSIEHIEANLIQDAAAACLSSPSSQEDNQNAEHDEYWSWHTSSSFAALPLHEQEAAAVASSNTTSSSYWNWPASRDAQIQLILQSIVDEEELRQHFTADHILAGMQAEAERLRAAQHSCGMIHQHHRPTAIPVGYWD